MYLTIKKVCKPTNFYYSIILECCLLIFHVKNLVYLKHVQFCLTINNICKPTNFYSIVLECCLLIFHELRFSIIYTKVNVILSDHDCKPTNTKFNLYFSILGVYYVVVTCMHVVTAFFMTIDKLQLH